MPPTPPPLLGERELEGLVLGPYRLAGPLGRGGMGAVYRAERVDTGELAAVKTVGVPTEGLLAGIRREIRALARVRHPGIVRIVGHGVDAGVPWYAMELIAGDTLRAHCRRVSGRVMPVGTPAGLPDVTDVTRNLRALPEPGGYAAPMLVDGPRAAAGDLAAALALVRRLCAPLGFLHGEGLVHRDLKPDNVVIRPDGTPVLVDFGVAAQFGGAVSRESLEVGGQIAGTVLYMAPEQLVGELVDARADLYALGCILYELVTGRLPFGGEGPAAVVRQHLDAPPSPPSRWVDGLPAELDELVLRLLAKRPRDRLGHADDVAAALAGLGAGDEPLPGPRARAYLYRPGLAGRGQPVAAIDARLVRLADGAGGLIAIGGESGVGKTRLALEAARSAHARGLQVLTGEGSPPASHGDGDGRGGAPLHPLRRALQAIADRCRERGRKETEWLLGTRGKVLVPYEPALAGLPGLDQLAEPPELPAEAARLRLFRALADALAAFGEEEPLLLILDDLHWADDLTVDWLLWLVGERRLERAAVLVLATYRREELGPALARLVGGPRAIRIDLDRLDGAALAAMAGDMLAHPAPPPGLLAFLARHSEGNPFFVAEYLRLAVSEGLLGRDLAGRWSLVEGADWESLPLPGSLRELLARRLAGLSPAAARVLDAAAVLGRAPDPAALAALCGGAPLDEPLDELAARQLLDDAGGELRFAHDKLREAVYAELPAERRAALHRAAAIALAPAAAGEQLAALAHHWEQAGEPAQARPRYLEAARWAAARYAHGEAERLYRAALAAAAAPDPAAVQARCELAREVLFLRGRNQEALAELERALADARGLGEPGLEGIACLGLASVQRVAASMRDARASCEQALALLRGCGDRRGAGEALVALGSVCWEQGRLDEACARYEEALAVHREVANYRAEGETLSNLGSVYWDLGRLHEARAAYDLALAMHRAAGNRRWEGVTLSNLGCVALEEGRAGEATTLCEAALAIHGEVGDRRFESVTLATLAQLAGRRGAVGEARALGLRALAVHREVGNRADEVSTLLVLAALERTAGRFDAAAGRLAEAEAAADALDNPLERALCLCERGRLERAGGGSGAEALAAAEAIVAAAELAGDRELAGALAALRAEVKP